MRRVKYDHKPPIPDLPASQLPPNAVITPSFLCSFHTGEWTRQGSGTAGSVTREAEQAVNQTGGWTPEVCPSLLCSFNTGGWTGQGQAQLVLSLERIRESSREQAVNQAVCGGFPQYCWNVSQQQQCNSPLYAKFWVPAGRSIIMTVILKFTQPVTIQERHYKLSVLYKSCITVQLQ